MASNECYHFTKLNRAYGIARNGLVPRLEENSKAVKDSTSKISFSDGRIAAAGLYTNFYSVYMAMKERKRTPTDKRVLSSKNIEDYLGEGIYLMFDGTDIENTGGNGGHINPFDAATKIPILPENLKVCILRDSNDNIHFSQYDYIKFIIANMSEEDYIELKKIDTENVILKCIKEYKMEYKDEIDKFTSEEYTPELMTLEEFCKIYQSEINNDIHKYIQTHFKDTYDEIGKLSAEFKYMPKDIQNKLDECKNKYKKMMNELINGNLSEIDIPIDRFYELYRDDLDGVITQYCESIIEDSR